MNRFKGPSRTACRETLGSRVPGLPPLRSAQTQALLQTREDQVAVLFKFPPWRGHVGRSACPCGLLAVSEYPDAPGDSLCTHGNSPPVSLRTQNVKQNKCSHLATENALLSGHCQPHRGSEDGRHLHFHGEMCLEGLLPLVGSPSPL